VRRAALAAAVALRDAAARSGARAAPAQGLLCGLSPDIIRVAVEDDSER
jgi:hypothetical protein